MKKCVDIKVMERKIPFGHNSFYCKYRVFGFIWFTVPGTFYNEQAAITHAEQWLKDRGKKLNSKSVMYVLK